MTFKKKQDTIIHILNDRRCCYKECETPFDKLGRIIEEPLGGQITCHDCMINTINDLENEFTLITDNVNEIKCYDKILDIKVTWKQYDN